MKEKRYFYFASPHSFKYPLFVYLKFVRNNDLIIHRGDHSKWIEVNDYTYYGEPVKCIIPAQLMEYDMVFSMLSSKDSDNIFGAINYLFYNYRKKFVRHLSTGLCPSGAADIMFQYFIQDVTQGDK